MDLAVQTILTKQMVERAHEESLLRHTQQMIAHSFVQKMVIGGNRVFDIEEFTDYDPSLRAWVINDIAEVDSDPRGAALIAQANDRAHRMLGAMIAVDNVPLWRLLWVKLRRRRLVEFS